MNKFSIFKINNFFFITFVILFLLIFFISTSDFFLIAGSDAVDHTYKVSIEGRVILSLLVITTAVSSFFRIANKKATFLAILLSSICSQSVVDSGRSNKIKYFFMGLKIVEISTKEAPLIINESKLLFQRVDFISKDEKLIMFMPPCPFCIDLKDHQVASSIR